MENYACPICNVSLEPWTRYPNYACEACAKKATDKAGRKLVFYNLGMDGGFGASYEDNDEIYPGHICFIEGIECYADEHRFGGIVIEKR